MSIRLTGTRGEINLMVIRLRQAFASVEAGDYYEAGGQLHCDVAVTF